MFLTGPSVIPIAGTAPFTLMKRAMIESYRPSHQSMNRGLFWASSRKSSPPKSYFVSRANELQRFSGGSHQLKPYFAYSPVQGAVSSG
jgi:hypothetical protein